MGIDLDLRRINAEGADCGIGIATLPAHVAMTPALDDLPTGPMDHWTMLITYTADSRRHLVLDACLTSSERNPELPILYGME
jgi:hypothetical protein